MPTERRRRPRAGKACTRCRDRKVRCDAVLRLPGSCTNCLLDQVECSLPARRKQPYPERGPDNLGTTTESQYECRGRDRSSTTSQAAATHSTRGLFDDNADFMLHASTFRALPTGSWNPPSELVAPFETSLHPGSHGSHNPSQSPRFRLDNPMFKGNLAETSLLNNNVNNSTTNANNNDISRCDVSDDFFVDIMDFTSFLPEPEPLSSGPQSGVSVTDHALPNARFSDLDIGDHLEGALMTNSMHNRDTLDPVTKLLSSPLNSSPNPDSVAVRLVDTTTTKHTIIPSLSWVRSWTVEQPDLRAWKTVVEVEATSIPCKDVVDDLVRLYFQFFHPSLPILSELNFFHMLNSTNNNGEQPHSTTSLAMLNAIMWAASGFVTSDDATRAGFSSIRAMRKVFFSRTKILYELGCETDSLARIQICLLLTFQRTYPDAMFENEFWALQALQLLQRANVDSILKDLTLNSTVVSLWKRAKCCAASRIIALSMATLRTSNMKPFSFRPFSIGMVDFLEDIDFPWFLQVDTKHHLTELFLARISLLQYTMPLLNFLLRLNFATDAEKSDSAGISILAETEQAEIRFAEWKSKNSSIIDSFSKEKSLEVNYQALALQHGWLNLTYQYYVSTLHQATLGNTRTFASKWTDKMRESSRQALWESCSSTIATLKHLLEINVVRYLPPLAVICSWLPLILNYIYLKGTMRCDLEIAYNLSIAAQTLQTLGERYDITDFYMDLGDATVAMIHEQTLGGGELSNSLKRTSRRSFSMDVPGLTDRTDPGLDIHAAVVRFINKSLAKGRVIRPPKSSPTMP